MPYTFMSAGERVIAHICELGGGGADRERFREGEGARIWGCQVKGNLEADRRWQ